MDKKLYVAWQDSERKWHTIGQLGMTGNSYEFVFTKGAVPYKDLIHKLFNLQLELGFRYRFKDLIPLFQNRIMNSNRPDFARLSNWVGASGNENDFEKLEKFGPIPGTDSMLIYPEPSVLNGRIGVDFYVHGIRHMHIDAQDWSNKVAVGQELLPMLDVQNESDPISAVALRARNNNILVGYVPAFYAKSISEILRRKDFDSEATFVIQRTNHNAPFQIRLFCRFEARLDSLMNLQSEESLLLLTQPNNIVNNSKGSKQNDTADVNFKRAI